MHLLGEWRMGCRDAPFPRFARRRRRAHTRTNRFSDMSSHCPAGVAMGPGAGSAPMPRGTPTALLVGRSRSRSFRRFPRSPRPYYSAREKTYQSFLDFFLHSRCSARRRHTRIRTEVNSRPMAWLGSATCGGTGQARQDPGTSSTAPTSRRRGSSVAAQRGVFGRARSRAEGASRSAAVRRVAAWLDPRVTREGLSVRPSGQGTYLAAKAKGDKSMFLKARCRETTKR
jgi:hypothetical protein